MELEQILKEERVHCGLAVASKKKAIQEASTRIASTLSGLAATSIYDGLIAREKLGTTAIGSGVAIPHCRVSGCDQIVGALFTLENPIDFGAYDDVPVNIVFVLLVPQEEVDEHLTTLSMLARRFESEEYRQKLLLSSTNEELFFSALDERCPSPQRNTAKL